MLIVAPFMFCLYTAVILSSMELAYIYLRVALVKAKYIARKFRDIISAVDAPEKYNDSF